MLDVQIFCAEEAKSLQEKLGATLKKALNSLANVVPPDRVEEGNKQLDTLLGELVSKLDGLKTQKAEQTALAAAAAAASGGSTGGGGSGSSKGGGGSASVILDDVSVSTSGSGSGGSGSGRRSSGGTSSRTSSDHSSEHPSG